MSKQQMMKTLENIKPGDLIAVDWCDASTGKSSMNGGNIDVPVRSWGVFLGLMGVRTKQIVMAQNSFKYSDSLFDMDYTAIPLGWAIEVKILVTAHINPDVARDMAHCFAMTGTNGMARTTVSGSRSPRMFVHRMQRLRCHG
ncbi:MAG: hypothetical protein NWF01_07890 [Candidatus Bathyarchaeota archaeon]|nr:hypothetical protein [Candidatus Bathyarchaeota archaeon]